MYISISEVVNISILNYIPRKFKCTGVSTADGGENNEYLVEFSGKQSIG
jgi:hypothetical protein